MCGRGVGNEEREIVQRQSKSVFELMNRFERPESSKTFLGKSSYEADTGKYLVQMPRRSVTWESPARYAWQ